MLLGGALAMIVRTVILAVRGQGDGRRNAGYMGGMIACIVGAHLWMFSTASDTAPRSWIGWAGFVPLLALSTVIGAVGILRSRSGLEGSA